MVGDIPYMQLITPMNRTRNRRAMDCLTNQNNSIRPTNPRMRIQGLKEQDGMSDSAQDLVHPNDGKLTRAVCVPKITRVQKWRRERG
jgi:hypothetical protein